MVLFNYSTKELTAKVVYYGPGLCGKTTNLQFVHENLPSTVKGKMLSLATKTDRTLFFDFLPLDLGTIRGMKTRIQLYTVPGQVFYNETRKLVLKGADGIVFVADSQEQMLQANVESFRNLEENLRTHGMTLGEMPHVIQFNKRDLPKISSVEEMNAAINRFNAPFYESVATTGIGVQDTLKAITKLVLLHLTKKYDPKTAASRPSTTNPPSRPSVPSRPVSTPPAVAATSIPVSSDETPESIPLASSPEPSLEPSGAPRAETPPPAVAERTGPPPPPNFHGPPADEPEAPRFDADEVEDFMGEVEEPGPAAIEPPPPAPAPSAESPEAEAGAIRPDETPFADDEPILSPFPLPGEDDGPDDEDDDVPEPIPFDAPLDTGPDSAPEPEPAPRAEAPTAGAGAGETAAITLAARGDEDEAEDAPPSFEIDASYDAPAPASGPAGSPGMAASSTTEPEDAPPPFEIDDSLDIDDAVADETHSEAEPVREPEDTDDAPIELSEAADDRSLFEDPGLDVARLAAGHAKEIVVPVELGEGSRVRRFKLSVTLKLDPVD